MFDVKVKFYKKKVDLTLEEIFANSKILNVGDIKDNLDEELDTANITILNEDKETFPRLARCFVTINDGSNEITRCYLVDSDNVECVETEVNEGATLYSHELFLIEPTTYLDGIKLPTLTFRNSISTTYYNDLSEAFSKLMVKFVPYHSNYTHPLISLFDYSSIVNDLRNYEFQEITINSGESLRDAINRFLDLVNGVVRASVIEGDSKVYLTIDYLNEIRDKKSIVEYGYYNSSNNMGEYSNHIISNVKNASVISSSNNYQSLPNANVTIPDNFDEKQSLFGARDVRNGQVGIGVRAVDTVVSSDNAEFIVPNIDSVREIKKVWFGHDKNSWRMFDITDFVLESTAWDLLDSEGFVSGTTSTYKQNSIKYVKGGNSLFGMGETNKTGFLLFTNSVLSELVSTLRKKYSSYIFESGPSSTINFTNIMFQVEYEPYINANIRVENDVTDEQNVYFGQISNQSDNMLDLQKYGRNLYGQVIRLGNDEYVVKRDLVSLNDLLNIGDYVNEFKAIITNVYLTLNNEQIIVEYTMSKNFNRIQQRIGVNSEIRQYNIPLDEVNIRNDNLSQYATFKKQGVEFERYSDNVDTYIGVSGTETSGSSGTFNVGFGITKSGIERMLNILSFYTESEDMVSLGLTSATNSSERESLNAINITSFGLNRSLCFHFKADTPSTIGDALNKESTGFLSSRYVLEGAEYAKDGVKDILSIGLGYKLGNYDLIDVDAVGFSGLASSISKTIVNEYKDSYPLIPTKSLNNSFLPSFQFGVEIGKVTSRNDWYAEGVVKYQRNERIFYLWEDTTAIRINKDVGETYALTYQLHAVTPYVEHSDGYYEDIVVGAKFFENNTLVGGKGNFTTRLRLTDTKLKTGDNIFSEGSSSSTISVPITTSINGNKATVTIGFTTSDSLVGKTIVLTDSSNNLILAINGTEGIETSKTFEIEFTNYKPLTVYGI